MIRMYRRRVGKDGAAGCYSGSGAAAPSRLGSMPMMMVMMIVVVVVV